MCLLQVPGLKIYREGILQNGRKLYLTPLQLHYIINMVIYLAEKSRLIFISISKARLHQC